MARVVSKREQHFAKIRALKEHLRDTPSELLEERLNQGILTKEGAIAARELIEERGGDDGATVDHAK